VFVDDKPFPTLTLGTCENCKIVKLFKRDCKEMFSGKTLSLNLWLEKHPSLIHFIDIKVYNE